MATSSAAKRAEADARRARRAEVQDVAIVLEAAAALLAVRQRAIAEMRGRLRRLGYSDQLVEEALLRLTELGYLDDAAFATAWVESRDRAHPRGTGALRRELARKGIAADQVTDVLDARAASGAEPDRDAAERLLARRASSLTREPDLRKRRGRAYALLARAGFDPGIASDVARSLVGEPDDAAEAEGS